MGVIYNTEVKIPRAVRMTFPSCTYVTYQPVTYQSFCVVVVILV